MCFYVINEFDVIIIIIIMSLSSVSLSEDSVGDAPMSREVQTAPLTQQDQSRHRGGVYFGSGHLACKRFSSTYKLFYTLEVLHMLLTSH